MKRARILFLVSPVLLACVATEDTDPPQGTGGGTEPLTSSATGNTSRGDEGDDDASTTLDASSESSTTGRDCVPLPWYPDVDGDGYGSANEVVMTCDAPPDHVPNGGDCNDADPAVNLAADEVCDTVDNDCDGVTDEPAATNPSCAGCSLFASRSSRSGYAVCPAAATWLEAQDQCATSFGGTLVAVDSAAENMELTALGDPKLTAMWLGLSDLEREGVFVWAEGSPLAYSNWNKGEPNDAMANEDCAQLVRPAGVWNDLDCITPLPFICEVPL